MGFSDGLCGVVDRLGRGRLTGSVVDPYLRFTMVILPFHELYRYTSIFIPKEGGLDAATGFLSRSPTQD